MGRMRNLFQGLRWQLLFCQLLVVAVIFGLVGLEVYAFFSRSLYQQLDKKLMTLAQAATPSLSGVQVLGDRYLTQMDEVPWRDIFNRDHQTLEWFNAQGRRLVASGPLKLPVVVEMGAHTTSLVQPTENADDAPVRTFTVSVFKDPVAGQKPTLEGYVRASQSLEDIQQLQQQLIGVLSLGGLSALGLAGLGGLWLTQRSLRPVETSYRQLKQFTADASHELRGPLTAIRASVDVMQNHPERIHPKDVKKLGAIASAATQMSYLAEDLLLLARMDVGETVVPRQSEVVDLGMLLRELLLLLEPAAKAKDVSLTLSGLAAIVMGDRAQLSRLFSNLLQNAVQYNRTGGHVLIAMVQDPAWVKIRVEDTGIGIAAAELPFIFDRFWRAEKARTRRAGGSGLGLAIAKAIVQQHGGRIGAKSQLDVGSCFEVMLPSRKSTPKDTRDM